MAGAGMLPPSNLQSAYKFMFAITLITIRAANYAENNNNCNVTLGNQTRKPRLRRRRWKWDSWMTRWFGGLGEFGGVWPAVEQWARQGHPQNQLSI